LAQNEGTLAFAPKCAAVDSTCLFVTPTPERHAIPHDKAHLAENEG
jgi:hypothetical protein